MQYGVRCHLQCAGKVELSDTFVATHLYRIAQEAINNAIKHGRAKGIDISLNGVNETITLSILDNGVGIADKRSSGPGMGLRIMKYRADLIGATLRIAPGKGQGTEVTCTALRGGSLQ